MCDIGCIQKIYNRLQDDKSRLIYINRLDYSFTKDAFFLKNMVDKTTRNTVVWEKFLQQLDGLAKDNELVIFGAGIWGNILFNETCTLLHWKYIVDSDPVNKKINNVPILAFDTFIKEYKGEYVVISSYKNYQEMAEQLQNHGIPNGRIIDAGSVIYQLTEKAIYFDLKELLPCREQEVFVDAGCFDGATTKQFFEWCSGKGYSYCLEPDGQNITSIRENLDGSQKFEIIDKALWSRTTVLSMNVKGNCATSIVEQDDQDSLQKIKAVALDDFLQDKEVTFIKMDIEGAETEALRGAEKIITGQKPRLAISIYHKPEDIWTIPQIILDYNPDYRLYLRHYSFADYDTVLYAIP